MNGEIVKLIFSNLTGIAMVLTLVYELVKYICKFIREKNWPGLLEIVTRYMVKAEAMFDNGADRKEWVMAMVKASADTVKYEVNMDQVSKLIDDLCKMSETVNGKVAEVGDDA